MLRDFRHPFAPSLILLAATSSEGDRLLRVILQQVIVRLDGAVTLRLDVLSEQRIRRPSIRTVMFIDGYEAFQRLYASLSVEKFDFSGRYLIVCSVSVDEELARSIFGDLWSLQIINVVLIGHGDSGPHMWSYEPYAAGRCAMVNLMALKPSDKHYPDKTLMYHGCPFKVGSFETRPFTIMERSDTEPLKMSGFEGDLLDTLKEKLNFTVQILEPENGEQWGYALPRNSTGMMRMIQEGEVDFGISCLGISVARSAILKAGLAHYTTSLVLAVPKGRPYTAFEKLFRPFEANVWWITVTVIAGAAFVIASIELRNQSVRNFVYGQQTHTPYLNLVQIFFGIAMHLLPRRNFARTLLIFWIYFCFVIRSLYQSALFRYLQQELTFPPSRSMAEIDQTKALYYVVESGERYYEAFPDRLLR
ncbi:AAEL003350-PA [Aedes aegypti]|uniref:AAEL003350-PA n=2 Tax=Aedes aegypti TaxID=7159 RepID=Q17FM8_AEDAE|nr:AAEL003350-PA [Aedes aegypti]